METSTTTQFQAANATTTPKSLTPQLIESNVAAARKTQQQTLVSSATTVSPSNLISTSIANIVPITNDQSTAAAASSIAQTIAHKVNSITNSTNLPNSTSNTASVANLITSNATTAVVSNVHSNGQATPTQQIIQVSSQGGAIMPGQQLTMVQTLAGRPAIHLRAGSQFQQIQLIPFGNLQGQNQRPVIIQQTPGNVQLHSSTITSMANLAHNNVAKITSVATAAAHQKPVIIQQTPGNFQLNSTNVQQHNLHGHNVTKIATVGRAPSTAQQGKMVLGHLTTAAAPQNHQASNVAATSGTTGVTTNHTTATGVLATNQQNHLTNNNTNNVSNNAATLTANTLTNPQQVTRLNIISSLPNVSNVQHATAGKPILSLATATLNKQLIINPASASVVQPSIVGNVVNMSNFNATSHQLKQPNTATNIIPTVMTLTTLTTSSGATLPGRHTMITSNSSLQPSQHSFNLASSSSLTNNSGQQQQQQQHLIINSGNSNANQSNSTNQQPQHINAVVSSTSISNSLQQQQTSQLNQQQQQSNSQSQSIASSSTMRSSNTLNSPIKQQLQPQTTPSSPRPSILIRKRVGTPLDSDSKMNYQSSININSANNAKSSQLNSVKQNLSLKFPNNTSSNLTSATGQSSNNSQLVGSSGAMKNAQDNLNSSSSSLNNKQTSISNQNMMMNNTIKKSTNLDSSGQLVASQSASMQIRNENDLLKNSKQIDNFNNQQQQLLLNNSSLNQSNYNNHQINNSNNNTTTVDNRQITPRKRRKQLLEPFMLTNSQNIKLLNDDSTNLLCNEELRKKDSFTNNYSTNNHHHHLSSLNNNNSICRRPRPSLLSSYSINSYNLSWKSLQYHFLRHAEVKIKNEKKVNLQELSNETMKRNSWKVNHLSTQLEDILECEISFNQKLRELSKLYSDNKNLLPPKIKELGNRPFNTKVRHNSISVLDKLTDLFAANIQRSSLIHDQLKDTNSILNKLTNDHKEKVGRMTKKFMNGKRTTTSVKA